MKRKWTETPTKAKKHKFSGDNPKKSDSDQWEVEELSEEDEEDYEQEYKKHAAKELAKISDKLPIKTSLGLEHPSEDEEEDDDNELTAEFDAIAAEESDEEPSGSKVITAVELLANQNKVTQERKLQIGSLSAGILENPDEKIHNFKTLFNILHGEETGGYITLKKLCVISLLEVFKDILPDYKINPESFDKSVKLKKDTLRLEKYESSLMQYYKKFLQSLERMSSILVKKKQQISAISQPLVKLGELAVCALCDLLFARLYFNYSENIAQTVVPFLNNRNELVRKKANETCKGIFREDKKGEITLKILRLINQYVKKHNNVHPNMIEVLLALRIKDVNLDEERATLMKQKKLQSHKGNVLKLSKAEKKRKARLKQLEKELLEVKAEENNQLKQKNQTEITKVAFGLLFRILKTSSNSKLVGVCLQGISKFSHCINVEFYVDLLNILNGLLKADWLEFQEKQRCIQTVFAILNRQEVLSLDPTRFYVAAYENLLLSKNVDNFEIVLETLTLALVQRHKKVTSKRMVSFVKRICTLSLHLLHNGTLACLGIIKSLLQLHKALDILLDVESSPGDGKYLPELNDPEYSNASATALYEVALLSRHYHPIVAEYSKYIALGVPVAAENSLANKYGRISAEELFHTYDMSSMAFAPSIPVPKKDVKPKFKHHYFVDSSLKDTCKTILRNNLK